MTRAGSRFVPKGIRFATPLRLLQTAAFFGLALLSRAHFWDIESRYQIIAFWVLADAVEIVRHRARLPSSIGGWLASALAAAAGILLMKWSIEGIRL